MIPILFSPTDTSFETFGIGHLVDSISPHVIEERNGAFTFEMQYPVDGMHYDEIAMRSIILAKPNPQQSAQPFRVYRITKPTNGIVSVYANHIHYDLDGVPVAPFSASSLFNALNSLVSNRLVESPFTFETDFWSNVEMSSITPQSTLSLLGGQEGSLIDIYGGEYLWDGYTVELLERRGSDSGITIRYGVDLIDLEQEENCGSCYTGVLCFWKNADGDQSVIGSIQSAGTFDYTKIKVVDRSENYETAPTADQLNADAVAYINANDIGVPRVSLTVSFATLEQTEEYENIRRTVSLCDYVKVEFERLGVSATAKIIRTDYDVINERFISVDIGDSRTSIADTIIGISTLTDNVPTVTEMAQAISATTAAITGADGGAVRLLDTDSDGVPDTLYIADDPDPTMAEKVWRFNYEGWGASANGYSGPFSMGATFAQGFIADFITAGTLSADRIGANTIAVSKLTGTISNGDWEIDFENGTLTIGSISASEITSGTLDASDITVTNLNADNITTGTLNVARIADESITGEKIGIGEITGGVSGGVATGNIALNSVSGYNLSNYTLGDLQVSPSGLSTASLSDGVNSSLGYADFSNDVFNGDQIANYIYASIGSITTLSSQTFSITNRFNFMGSRVYSHSGSFVTGGSCSYSTSSAFKVYDINGDERWVYNITGVSFNPETTSIYWLGY